jgi:hypothetical protein
MSQSVQDVLSAITVASEALTREPQLRSQLSSLEAQVSTLSQTVEKRELSILSLKDEISQLESKVRSLEVERDNAQFRTIELEDIIHNSLKAIRTASHRLDEAITDLDPPKPEPTVGKAVPDVKTDTYFTPPVDIIAGSGVGQTPLPTPSETGQSVTDPTPLHEPSSPTSGGETTGTASELPYAGKKWSEIYRPDGTRVWSRDEWFSGGGTEETYNQ